MLLQYNIIFHGAGCSTHNGMLMHGAGCSRHIAKHSISMCIYGGGSICHSVHVTLFSEIRPLVI